MTDPILSARGLVKSFPLRGGPLHAGFRPQRLEALRGVNLDVLRGECLALVGESGCGKTTLGKCLVGHLRADAGSVEHEGVDLASLRGAAWRRLRRRLQLVFQDSSQSFDPRLTVFASLAEALPKSSRDRERAAALLESVDLPADMLDRHPHQLSGGQRQRLGIARALAADAEVLVLDEPVSALDASVRGQILDLLRELRRARKMTMVFIGHDLGVVREVADRVAVLYLGRVVEIGPARDVLSTPRHPYTAALLDAVPRLTTSQLAGRGESRRLLQGDVPSAVHPPAGCSFHPRCSRAENRCRVERPMLRSPSDETSTSEPVSSELEIPRQAACHLPLPSS